MNSINQMYFMIIVYLIIKPEDKLKKILILWEMYAKAWNQEDCYTSQRISKTMVLPQLASS